MIRSLLTTGLALATLLTVLPLGRAQAGTCTGVEPRSTVGLWRDGAGLFIKRSKNTRMPADPLDATLQQFGASGDTPLVGNWSGISDDYAQVGIYRGAINLFVFRDGITPTKKQAGLAGDVAVVGDWDGDGVDTPGLFRNGFWYLYNSFAFDPKVPDEVLLWGQAGDIPIVGNWTGDGDGQDRVGVLRDGIGPNNSPVMFLRLDAVGITCAPGSTCNTAIRQWGDQGDLPVVGDWDRDGDTDIGVFRPSQAIFYLLQGLNPPTDPFTVLQYGTSTDKPISGDWDGCGTDNGT